MRNEHLIPQGRAGERAQGWRLPTEMFPDDFQLFLRPRILRRRKTLPLLYFFRRFKVVFPLANFLPRFVSACA